MAEVYVVTSGEYSSYQILAVFTNRSKAKRFAGVNAADVETWELDEDFTDPHPPGFYCWQVDVFDGKLERLKEVEFDKPYHSTFKPGELITHQYDLPPRLTVVCLAKNKKDAIKIALEKRSEWIADRRLMGRQKGEREYLGEVISASTCSIR